MIYGSHSATRNASILLRGRGGVVRMKRMRPGFTVLELLVTIAIATVLMALLLPAVHSARESARRVQCESNLRQIGLALHQHHDTIGHLPPGWTLPEGADIAEGWAMSILPWLEQSALKDRVTDAVSVWTAAAGSRTDNLRITETPSVFLCPSDSAEPLFQLFEDDENQRQAAMMPAGKVLIELPNANYPGVYGTSDPDEIGEIDGGGTFIASHAIRFRDLTNGLSQVTVVAERTARRLPSTWTGFHIHGEDAAGRVLGFSGLGPNQFAADECEFDSRHPGGINMLFADGHVRFVADDIDASVYRDLAKRQHQYP